MLKFHTVSLRIVLVVSLLVCMLGAGNALSAGQTTLIFQNNYPTKHSRLGLVTVGMWLDEVEKASGGKIKFERHWAGEPLPAKEALDGLSMGVVDLLCGFPPYYSGKVAIADISAMPKNFKTPEDVYDLWWNSPMGKLINDVYEKRAKVKVLFPIIFAPENFQVAKRAKKVRHFEDFKGMKIRAGGGMLMETVKAIHASPVHTHGGEYYTAMQRGIVDAGLMTTYSLETYKIWEVSDQVVNPPIMNNCWAAVYMNKASWDKLSPEMQKILVDSAKELQPKWTDHMNSDDARITKKSKEKGVEFYVLPKEDQKKMWNATDKVWDIYIEKCAKQGSEKEAKQVRRIVNERFYAQ